MKIDQRIVLANAKKVQYLMSDMFEIYKCIFKKINVNAKVLLISKSARIATKKNSAGDGGSVGSFTAFHNI